MMVAKHQGHIETSILPKKDDVETKVAMAQAEVVDVPPNMPTIEEIIWGAANPPTQNIKAPRA